MNVSSPVAAPHRPPPSAAALTSASSAIGTPSPDRRAETRSVSAQPGLGVVVIVPHVGEALRMSTGPNAPTPSAPTGPFSVKNRVARAALSAGSVVGNVSVFSGGRGSSAIAQTHFVPPASLPPYRMSRPHRGSGDHCEHDIARERAGGRGAAGD